MKFNKKFIYIILWMTLIFILSHASGEKSSEQSGVILKILEFFNITIPKDSLNSISFLIRKIAHITEYFILTFLILNYTFDLKLNRHFFYSALVAFLYASSDEFHQSFIPGRAGLISDVFIDSIGIFLALLFWKIFIGKGRKYETEKNRKK